jgi:mannose-6-phosphate isomerase-like protein (cupin superfamily)
LDRSSLGAAADYAYLRLFCGIRQLLRVAQAPPRPLLSGVLQLFARAGRSRPHFSGVWYDPRRIPQYHSLETIMPITRRDICFLLPGLFSAGAAIDAFAGEGTSLPSSEYPFEKLPVQTSDHAEIRQVLKGKLATGEALEVHETTLPVGGAPHPPHHHVHSEMWLIREGAVELTVNGASYRLGPGGVGFVHSNDEHGIKNVGSTAATYFVVAIGPGADA